MDQFTATPLKDINMLFNTPCKDFTLPDLSKTRNTPGIKGTHTISSIKFFPHRRQLWSSDINEPFESDLKQMSPHHLANKKISSSPWAARDLRKELISDKILYTEKMEKNTRSEIKPQYMARLPVHIQESRIQLIQDPRMYQIEHAKVPEIKITGSSHPTPEKPNKIWAANPKIQSNGNITLQNPEDSLILNSGHKNPTQDPYHSANAMNFANQQSKQILQARHDQVFANRTSQILHQQMNSQNCGNVPTNSGNDHQMLLEIGNPTNNTMSYQMGQRKRHQHTTTTSPVNLRATSKRMLARGRDNSNSNSAHRIMGHTQSMKPSMDKETPMKDVEYDEDKMEDDAFNEIKKRRRKSNVQLRILKNELDNDENWSKEKIFKVSKLTGLSESQVYKWCWDQKKKTDDIACKKMKNGATPTGSKHCSSIARDSSESSSDEKFNRATPKNLVFGSES